MKYANIIPLCGGMSIANEQATGSEPSIIYSYSPFKSNDSHTVNRYQNVKYEVLDQDGKIYQEDLDFVSTVCPCAGMSMFSTGKKGHGAAQNDWMYITAKLVLKDLKPKVFFGENAPGLYTKMGKEVANDLFNIGQENGYSFSIYKTNTLRHGIPQSRVRTFYFFWKSEYAPIMGWYNTKYKKLKEYLDEIPLNSTYHDINQAKLDLEKDYTWLWAKSYFKDPRNIAAEKKYGSVFAIAKGENLLQEMSEWLLKNGYEKGAKRAKAIYDKTQNGGGFWDSSKYIFNNYFNALIGRSMNSLHPSEDRNITLREGMHLMGLPLDYELTDSSLKNHITQNVPVSTAKDMTFEVIKFINNELKFSNSKFLKQNNLTEDIVENINSSVIDFIENN